MGYMATGETTGWPLYTPRYDGAFVAGLYGADPALAGGPDDRLSDPDVVDARAHRRL